MSSFYQLHQQMLNEMWPFNKPEVTPQKRPEHDPRWAELVAKGGPDYARYVILSGAQMPPSNGPAKYRPNPYERTDLPGDPHATGDLRTPETDPLSKAHWSQG